MFSTFKQRLLLGVYIFMILSIPVGAYLASQNQTVKSRASEGKEVKVVNKIATPSASPKSPAKELLSLSESDLTTQPPSPNSSSEPASPTIATSFGPTLSLKVSIEGRPKETQATKLFVGIMEGNLSANPKFLLSFSVNLGKDGTYTNLSLAGLNSGSKYTALLKGSAQIATSSAFIMSPTVTNLNDGEAINLLTGDLNEDNTINSQDYTIAVKALNSTSVSKHWNENVDFNKDGVINLFDLALITKNLNKTGASGAWTSPLPKVATPSGSLASQSANLPTGAPDSPGGYWMWIPK